MDYPRLITAFIAGVAPVLPACWFMYRCHRMAQECLYHALEAQKSAAECLSIARSANDTCEKILNHFPEFCRQYNELLEQQ